MSYRFLFAALLGTCSLCSCAETSSKPTSANPDDDKGIIGKMTDEVVDAKIALSENADLIVLDTGNLGSDPLTQSTNAYVYVRAQTSTLGMVQQINAHRALNDAWPTLDELKGTMKEYNIKFTMLKPWQTYGYDSETGIILILQDEAVKKERFEKSGIDYVKGQP